MFEIEGQLKLCEGDGVWRMVGTTNLTECSVCGGEGVWRIVETTNLTECNVCEGEEGVWRIVETNSPTPALLYPATLKGVFKRFEINCTNK